ncbi:MAG: STAS domain-containing protein [Actinomycetota bacterium]
MSTRDVLYAAYSFALPVPGTGLLRITGELDAYSAELIEQQVRQTLAPGFDRLVLDLSDLEFIDSTGIRLLIHVITQKQHPSDIVVLSPQAITARRALEIVGFTRIIRTVGTLEEALSTPSAPKSQAPTLTQAGQ